MLLAQSRACSDYYWSKSAYELLKETRSSTWKDDLLSEFASKRNLPLVHLPSRLKDTAFDKVHFQHACPMTHSEPNQAPCGCLCYSVALAKQMKLQHHRMRPVRRLVCPREDAGGARQSTYVFEVLCRGRIPTDAGSNTTALKRTFVQGWAASCSDSTVALVRLRRA